MNIKEIKAIYLTNLEEICESCYSQIDNHLILGYDKILEHEPITIHVCHFYSDYERSAYFKDVIAKMKQHYHENWDISFNKKTSRFAFTYKGSLTDILKNPKEMEEAIETDIIEEEIEEDISRSDLMDIE